VVLRPDLHLRAASLRASLRFLTTARGGAALRGPGVLLRPALLRLRAALRALRRLLRTLAALRAAGLLRLTALGATRALCLLRRTGRCTAGLRTRAGGGSLALLPGLRLRFLATAPRCVSRRGRALLPLTGLCLSVAAVVLLCVGASSSARLCGCLLRGHHQHQH